MTLRIQQLIDLWGQPRGASLDPQQPIGAIVTDSRRMETGGFFVPLVGERFDGHAYLCLLYTSPSPRDYAASRMPSSA